MSTAEFYSLQDLAKMGVEIRTSKYGGIVPELPEDQYEGLKESIAENGLYEPITINQSGFVLDGHHRFKACQELSIPARFAVKSFGSEVEERIFVREANLARRQVSTLQRAELALALKPDYAEKAKLNMSLGGRGGGLKVSQHYETFHTDERLAGMSNMSKGTFEKAEKLLEAEQESPEQFGMLTEAVRENRMSVNKGYHRMRKAQAITKRKAELAKAAEERRVTLPDNVTLLNLNSRGEIPEIEENSIDLIITDPPYAKDQLHLFEALSDFAARKLRPGGSLVFYSGQALLPQIMAIFSKHEGTLNYCWQFAVKHNGPHSARYHPLGIWAKYKPMLWFTKGEESRLTMIHREKDMEDFIESEPPKKERHPWAQSEVEANFFIYNLTLDRNALVVDPYLGSGAFGIAAAKLGRQFIGIEIDKATYEKARLNFEQALAVPKEEEEEHEQNGVNNSKTEKGSRAARSGSDTN